jgi:hypothetical protein
VLRIKPMLETNAGNRNGQNGFSFMKLVPAAGIEPATSRLQGGCSTS